MPIVRIKEVFVRGDGTHGKRIQDVKFDSQSQAEIYAGRVLTSTLYNDPKCSITTEVLDEVAKPNG